MAVINFLINCAVIISVAQSISASDGLNSKNTFKALNVLLIAVSVLIKVTMEDAESTPGAPCEGAKTFADGDGDHIANVFHHTKFYLGQMLQKILFQMVMVVKSCHQTL